MASKKHTEIKNKNNSEDIENKNTTHHAQLLKITIKALILILIVGIGLFYSDYKGYFNPDNSNNHTEKKWNWFYKFSKKSNVDILLLGNSHLYSGINPKNLSAALGANAFILASPGTHIGDAYFGLKEALKESTPSLVIIETFGINNFDPYSLKEGNLSDQFKSFSARKNIVEKIISTPSLFNVNNYPYAWSNTLRNHDFLYNNKKQLETNLKIIRGEKKTKKDKLYLGRFVRFTKGLQKDILNEYDSKGAPVDGSKYEYSKYAEAYVDKIVSLCKEKDIKLLFLTLPMYSKHVSNYKIWKNKLSGIISNYNSPWLDLQLPEYTNDFPEFCFENTYDFNQHITYQGSLIATYKLAKFIKHTLNINLPNRSNDINWQRKFYGEEGYFENYPVLTNDKINKVIAKNKAIRNITLKDVFLIKESKRTKLLVKIERSLLKGKNLNGSTLILAIKMNENNSEKVVTVQLRYDAFHDVEKDAIFTQYLNSDNIIDIVDGEIRY
ncbi:MAG: hypothetical protein JEZ09_17625 [Salinivirgaceae bacterium]|nr:hypothetical protein [Salinivirgaceae bacterium]